MKTYNKLLMKQKSWLIAILLSFIAVSNVAGQPSVATFLDGFTNSMNTGAGKKIYFDIPVYFPAKGEVTRQNLQYATVSYRTISADGKFSLWALLFKFSSTSNSLQKHHFELYNVSKEVNYTIQILTNSNGYQTIEKTNPEKGTINIPRNDNGIVAEIAWLDYPMEGDHIIEIEVSGTRHVHNNDNEDRIVSRRIRYVNGSPQKLNIPQFSEHKYLADGGFEMRYAQNNYNEQLNEGNYPASTSTITGTPNHWLIKMNGYDIPSLTRQKAGSPASFTKTLTLNAAEFKSNIGANLYSKEVKLKIESTRTDTWSSANSSYVIRANSWLTDEYIVPNYPQPTNLLVTKVGTGQLKLTWTMVAGKPKSPADNFDIRWKGKNGEYTTVNNSIAYDINKTSYEHIMNIPVQNEGKYKFDFEVKRKGLNWNVATAKTSHTTNTNISKITTLTVTQNISDVDIKWNVDDGVLTPDHQFALTILNQSGVVYKETFSLTTKIYKYANPPVCSPYRYRLELIDTSKGSGEVVSSKEVEYVRLDANIENAEVLSFDGSKGYFSDRSELLWTVGKGNPFSNFKVTRYEMDKDIYNDSGIEIANIKNDDANKTNYRIDDDKVIVGEYYRYKLEAIAVCGASNTIKPYMSVGFSQPYGVVSGRIAYTGDVAVEGITVAVEGDNDYNKNKSLDLNGETRVETPYSKDMLSASKGFALQSWVKLRSITGDDHLRSIISLPNGFGIGVIKDQLYYFINESDGSDLKKVPFTESKLNTANFMHIGVTSIQKGSHTTVELYIDGAKVDEITSDIFTPTSLVSSNILYIGAMYKGDANLFNGYIDEVRVWDRLLSTNEMENNYDRFISGKELGLVLYYRMDEKDIDEVFDVSSKSNVHNKRHGKIIGTNVKRSTENIPTVNQLSIKGTTDATGQYLINTVPYTGDGASYKVIPMLGAHKFNPSNRPLYISGKSSVANNVDFTDISSFEVTGEVTYEGGNYPVEGCMFYVDGRPVQDMYGTPITSNDDGQYTISVPIGVHELKVSKSGHVFEGGGLALESGRNPNFDKEKKFNFTDNTKVKVIGRVVGGDIQGNFPLGFGDSKNNIGVDKVELTASKSNYKLFKEEQSKEWQHNNGQWTKPNARKEDVTKYTVKDNIITVTPSPETGEFVAYLPPVQYTIGNITPKGYTQPVFQLSQVDLTDKASDREDLMLKNTRTWVDTVIVKDPYTQNSYKKVVESSDYVYYNHELAIVHYSVPEVTIKQKVAGQIVDYWGDESIVIDNTLANIENNTEDKIEIISFDNDKYEYNFGKPVFHQGGTYTFDVYAYERYRNLLDGTNPIYDDVPLSDATVVMKNSMGFEEPAEGVEISLDSIGQGAYKFQAGVPDLTTGIKQFEAVLNLDTKGSFNWKLESGSILIEDNDATVLKTYLLGAQMTGIDFMTTGPEEIDIILRDPPGSNSYAYISKGTTVTKSTTASITGGITSELLASVDLGADVVTFVGIGAGTIFENRNTVEIGAGIESSTGWTSTNTSESSITFTESFQTSDSPEYVGHSGDVFVGNSTNIQYGAVNQIGIYKADKVDPSDVLMCAKNGAFAISKSTGIATGQVFATRFAYTELELEEIMIPKWKVMIENQLLPKGASHPAPESIISPAHISVLDKEDPKFGKKNTDKVFGSAASGSENIYNGPSYITIFPSNFEMSTKVDDPQKGKPYMQTYVDSIKYFNDQIDQWEKILAQNEEEKTKSKLLKNYSFGGGANIQWEKEVSSLSSISHEFSAVLDASIFGNLGTELLGIDVSTSIKTTISVGSNVATEESKQETTIVGFELSDDGNGDQISVDCMESPSGTIVFKSRGGRTSCPYEPERKSKYFEPGRHILSELSMQIEVPKINFKAGSNVFKVPGNRPASLVLELKNESETSDDIWYKLLVDHSTNPHGAVLKIDGATIKDGQSFLVKSGVVLEKTLTVEKGPNVDEYNDIKLLLVSECQYDPTDFIEDIYDETTFSVHFLPACSEVNFKRPSDNWLMNTTTSDSLTVELDGYDVNYPSFAYVDLQYKPTSSAQWTSLMYFFTNQTSYDASSASNKTLLGSSDNSIIFDWNAKLLPDGVYELRAQTICMKGTQVVSEYTTPSYKGMKDMVRPTMFGKAHPVDGILKGTGDIMIQFNEEIDEGLVTKNNFSIKGVKNGSVTDHSTSVHFDGESGYVVTEQELNLEDKSFTIEFWAKRNELGRTVLLTHGTPNKAFIIGFNESNKLEVSIGDQTLVSERENTNVQEWQYFAVVYDNEANTISAYSAVGGNDEVELNENPVSPYKGIGPITLGCNQAMEVHGAMDIHGLKIWNKSISYNLLVPQMYNILSGNEINLLAYWPMDEGKGQLLHEKARSRHAISNAEWAIHPRGKAIKLDGISSSLEINTASTVTIDETSDFSVEIWFRSDNLTGALFSSGRGDDSAEYSADGKFSIYSENGILKFASKKEVHTISQNNYMDNKWHHLVVSVRRTGAANIYIDGELASYFASNNIGTLASPTMMIGVRQWQEKGALGNLETKSDMHFEGSVDEFRIWNTALSSEYIESYGNVRLNKDEAGLIAYYPFEFYKKNINGVTEVTYTVEDQSRSKDSAPAAVATNISVEEETAPIKDAGPEVEYRFNVVTNKDRIILNLMDNAEDIENTYITISAQDIKDLHGNNSNAHYWSAYIDRSFLKWGDPEISKVKKNGEKLSFNVSVVNTGGNNESFTIQNIPSWLEVAPAQGKIAPASSMNLKFTVHKGINIGMYEEVLSLKGDYTNNLVLKLNVGGEKPDWTVDPGKHHSSMSVIGQIKINGLFSKDENDLVAAFIDNECVGVASPTYNKAYDIWQVMLNIYYSSSDNPIEFRIWDASTGKTYVDVLPTNVTFKPNTLQGSMIDPLTFETTNALLQTIDLKTGWNWISFNSQATALRDVNSLFRGISNGMEVKGQQAGIFSRYDATRNIWLNSDLGGKGLNNSQMYLVKMDGANTLSISGVPLDPAQAPMTLKSGWNWISYIPQINMTVSEAFGGLTASEGDIVKSILGFAVYDTKLGWVGSLEYMIPNQGYMYRAVQNATFNYPSHSSLARWSSETSLFDTKAVSKYENNLSLIGEVDLGVIIPESAQLVAKVNGEVRGTASVTEIDGKQLFFTHIQAENQNDMISFSIMMNNEEIKLSKHILFSKNEVIGSLEKPMVFTANSNGTVVYPNPFTDHLYIEITSEKSAVAKVSMYNMTGNLILSSDYEVNTGENQIKINENVLAVLTQGVYILRIEFNDSVEVFKLIKRP